MIGKEESIEDLRKAYTGGNLAIYAGAGVSVGSGLPSWQNLVLAMYLSALSKRSVNPRKINPSYLFATAEWHLEGNHEPLEITARKLRRYYDDNDDFIQHLWETLYAGFLDACASRRVGPDVICSNNKTLEAIARLCKASTEGIKGVKSVISYNYDSLLEIALGDHPYQSIYESERLESGRMPIYHVHGFVPLNIADLKSHDIVFTEDQYHQSAKDAYSWSSLIQIQTLSSATGIMVGLSLSDRNMRRLLDAVSQMPIRSKNYALLKKPDWRNPDEADLNMINEMAWTYYRQFDQGTSGFVLDSETDWKGQIKGIVEVIRREDLEQQTFILEQLGVHPIWYAEYSEIPGFLDTIGGL